MWMNNSQSLLFLLLLVRRIKTRPLSTPGFPVLHSLLEFSQTHVHSVSDAIQPSHPLSPPSPPALNRSESFSSE